jgi:hypothetical protein
MDYISLPHTEAVPLPLYDAARIYSIMRAEQQGRWRLRHFTVTEEEYTNKMRMLYVGSDHPEEEMARCVPPGDYVSLQRRMIEQEVREMVEDQIDGTFEDVLAHDGLLERIFPDDSRWIPVMSDTPAEILEHWPALLQAKGRVLITGLGLGCLPHALLAGYHRITRIDIIEIDPDVRKLTGKYLDDPRVHIWPGSADDLTCIPADVRKVGWDYAWHDIWTHISPRNLSDDEAEHGISYRMLFDLWQPYAKVQSAWAFDMAQNMAAIRERAIKEQREFIARVRAASPEEQVEMLYNHVLSERIRTGENVHPFRGERVPEEFARMLDPEGDLKEHVRKRLQDPDFWSGWDARDAVNDVPEPLGRPNEILGANPNA